MEIKRSKVKYFDGPHEYWLGDKQLDGITQIIKKMLFPNMYDNIPPHIMEAARERGSEVHRDIEFIDSMGVTPSTKEGENYLKLKQKLGLKSILNEFLVSDEQRIATKIDIVLESTKDSVSLVDAKTTSKLDKEYLSWQLSTCAWLFTRQTGIKVDKVYGLWLREDITELVEVELRPEISCKQVFDDYYAGVRYSSEVPVKVADTPAEVKAMEDWFIQYESEKKAWKEKEEELKTRLLELMNQNGVKKFVSEHLTITLKDAYERQSLDSGTLKAEMPEVYDKYIKTTHVEPSITIKVK